MKQEKLDKLEGVGDIKEATVSSEAEDEPFMEEVEEAEESHMNSEFKGSEFGEDDK